jgi:hypothetical protein
MGSRLLPLLLALCTIVADIGGFHRIALYLVLLAVVGAAAAAIVGVGDILEGRSTWLRAGSTGAALALLLLGSAARANAAVGAPVPALALSAVVGAVILYSVPLVAWLLEPLAPRPRDARVRARAVVEP